MPSREISELSLPETLKEPPVVKSKSLSPTNRKRLSTEKSSEKLRIRSRSPLARSPSFGTKTPVESPFTRGPGGVIIPV